MCETAAITALLSPLPTLCQPAPVLGCTCRAAGKGGANGSLRFELGVRPNTNKNIIDAAGLCDRWRTMINNALVADPKVRKIVNHGSSCFAAALGHLARHSLFATAWPQLAACNG